MMQGQQNVKQIKNVYRAYFVNPSFLTDKYISRLITNYSRITKQLIKRGGD